MSALIDLYRGMTRSRAFELAMAGLWNEGRISGEMHLATGEEALCAGVAAVLEPGDAVALDHRPSALMLLLGVDPVEMLRELLGREDGLCGGWGGHMHLFSREHLAASSGIVGAAGPLGAGFALAARYLRPGKVAMSFFGEGAANQGMLLESLNLAAAWNLPQVFVCKNNGWAITTRSESQTGGRLVDRARAFGLEAREVDGLDPLAVEEAIAAATRRARGEGGPSFLECTVSRLDGHFLGDPLVGTAQHPISIGAGTLASTTKAVLTPRGGSLSERSRSMTRMLGLLKRAREETRDSDLDPLVVTQRALIDDGASVDEIDRQADQEMAAMVVTALEEPDVGA